jgi:hypothetical protein
MDHNQAQEVKEMQMKIHLAAMALLAAMGLVWASGCASSSVAPSSSTAPSSGIAVENPPMTAYMRSQIGTPNELSPIAPAAARNMRKVGNQWLCDINGQVMVFDAGASSWEPQH